MKSILVLASLAALLCAGCADQTWGNRSERNSMGAGAASGTLCNDGTVLPPNSSCKIHGGISGQAVRGHGGTSSGKP